MQAVGLDQLGHHQTQAHTALGLLLEQFGRDRGLVGVGNATLLQVGAGAFHQALHFGLDAGLGQVQLGLGDQGVHGSGLVAGLQAELDFTLQVFLDVGAQGFDGAVGNAQGLDEGLVHFGQVGGFHLVQGDQEIGLLAGHFLAVVILGEVQRKGLGLARLHAAHRVFKLLQHLAFTHQELEAAGLAAFKRLTVDLAFEVDGHAVAVLRGLIGSALAESAALLAQDVHGAVDGGIVHFSGHFFDFGGGQVVDLDFGEHFEDGFESDHTLGRALFFIDAGLASDAQLRFVGGCVESLAHFVVHHFVLDRIAVLFGDDAHRHLAGAETIHLDLALQALQAGFDFFLDRVHRQLERDLALQLFQGFNVDCHGVLLCRGNRAALRCHWGIRLELCGARGGTRTPTPLLASGPKPGASTNFATRADLDAGQPGAGRSKPAIVISWRGYQGAP